MFLTTFCKRQYLCVIQEPALVFPFWLSEPPFGPCLLAPVDYQDVLDPSGKLTPSKHDGEHHLSTNRGLVTAWLRHLDPALHVTTRSAFEDMEWQGIVRQLLGFTATRD
jgi:hypothetical protein